MTSAELIAQLRSLDPEGTMEVVTPEFDNCIWWLRVAEVGIVDVEEHAGAFTTIDKAKWYRFSGGVPRRVIVIEQ